MNRFCHQICSPTLFKMSLWLPAVSPSISPTSWSWTQPPLSPQDQERSDRADRGANCADICPLPHCSRARSFYSQTANRIDSQLHFVWNRVALSASWWSRTTKKEALQPSSQLFNLTLEESPEFLICNFSLLIVEFQGQIVTVTYHIKAPADG
jgi:hypothetical protein